MITLSEQYKTDVYQADDGDIVIVQYPGDGLMEVMVGFDAPRARIIAAELVRLADEAESVAP